MWLSNRADSKALCDKTNLGTGWPIRGRGAKAPPSGIRCESPACHRDVQDFPCAPGPLSHVASRTLGCDLHSLTPSSRLRLFLTMPSPRANQTTQRKFLFARDSPGS